MPLMTTPHQKGIIEGYGLNWNLSNPYTRHDKDQFHILRDGVLNQALAQGRISNTQFHEVDDFEILFVDQTVSFKVPGTSHRVSFGFEELSDTRVTRSLNYLIGRANAQNFYGRKIPLVGENQGKGNPNGAKPLEVKKPSDAVKALKNTDMDQERARALPSLLEGVPPAERKSIVRRIAHADFVIYRMKNELNNKIRAKETELQTLQAQDPTPQNTPIRMTLTADIKELNAMKAKFEGLDSYAITLALAKLPHGKFNYDDLDRVTNDVKQQVRSDLEGNSKKTGWFSKGVTLTKSDEDYIQGVAGLLHRSRGEYSTYCKKEGISLKQECLEDLIIHEAVRVADGATIKSEKIEKAFSFQSMRDDLKKDVAKMFERLERVAVSDAFPDDTNDYTGDQNAIRNSLVARWNLLNLEAPIPPSSGVRSPTPNGVIARAITSPVGRTAMVAAGALLVDRFFLNSRFSPDAARQAVDFAVESPGQAFQGGFLAHSAVGTLRRLTSRVGEIPTLTAGAVTTVAVANLALGVDLDVLGQAAQMSPQHATAILLVAQRVMKAMPSLYNYVLPEERVAGTGLNLESRRRVNLRNLANVVTGIVAAVGAASYAAAIDYEDDEVGYVEGVLTTSGHYTAATINLIWMNVMFAGILLNIIGSQVRKPKSIAGKLLSETVSVLQGVQKTAGVFHLLGRVVNCLSGSLPVPASGDSAYSDKEPKIVEIDDEGVPVGYGGPAPNPYVVLANGTGTASEFLDVSPADTCPVSDRCPASGTIIREPAIDPTVEVSKSSYNNYVAVMMLLFTLTQVMTWVLSTAVPEDEGQAQPEWWSVGN